MKPSRVVRGGVFIDDRSEHGGDELTGLPPADVINVQSFWKFIDLPSLLDALAFRSAGGLYDA